MAKTGAKKTKAAKNTTKRPPDLALRYLENGEMLSLTGDWLEGSRASFQAIAEIAPLLRLVEAAHAELETARPADGASGNPALDALSVQQRATDVRHDHALRAIYFAHEAMAEYHLSLEPPDEAAAAAVIAARNRLLPDGLAGTQLTYAAEAGNAARALKLAKSDAKVKAALSSLGITKKIDGEQLVAHWAGAGAELGALEGKRAKLEETLHVERTGDRRPTVLRARNRWMKVVSTVLQVLDQADSPPKAIATIRATVKAAADKVAKRSQAARRKKQGKKGPPPTQGGGGAK